MANNRLASYFIVFLTSALLFGVANATHIDAPIISYGESLSGIKTAKLTYSGWEFYPLYVSAGSFPNNYITSNNDGNPQLAFTFYYLQKSSVYHAKWIGGAYPWTLAKVDDGTPHGIALDGQDKPAVVYAQSQVTSSATYYSVATKIKIAYWNSESWDIATVKEAFYEEKFESIGGGAYAWRVQAGSVTLSSPRIAFSVNDPHVVWAEKYYPEKSVPNTGYTYTIKHDYSPMYNGDQSIMDVDNGCLPEMTSDKQGQLLMLYISGSNCDFKLLMHAAYGGTNWKKLAVYNSAGIIYPYSIASENFPGYEHVVFKESLGGTHNLKYSFGYYGSFGFPETVYAGPIAQTSIQVDSGNIIHVGFTKVGDNDLVYTKKESGLWQTPHAIDSGDVGTGPISMTLVRFLHPPLNPNFAGAGKDSIILQWLDDTIDETLWEIQRSNDGSNWQNAGEVAGTQNGMYGNYIGYEDKGLSPNTSYYHRIRSVSAQYTSPWSEFTENGKNYKYTLSAEPANLKISPFGAFPPCTQASTPCNLPEKIPICSDADLGIGSIPNQGCVWTDVDPETQTITLYIEKCLVTILNVHTIRVSECEIEEHSASSPVTDIETCTDLSTESDTVYVGQTPVEVLSLKYSLGAKIKVGEQMYGMCISGGASQSPDPFDFSMSIDPPSGSLNYSFNAQSIETAVDLELISGNTEPVYIEAFPPSGLEVNFFPPQCEPTCTSLMKIFVSPAQAVGSYNIPVEAESVSGVKKGSIYTLTINKQASGGTGGGPIITPGSSGCTRVYIPILGYTDICKPKPPLVE